MKKISNWLFRKDLELNKRWWHRLIKVSYLLIAGLVTVGFLGAVFFEPVPDFYLNHNVSKVSLRDYTKNYKGSEVDNVLGKFSEVGNDFGIVVNDILIDKIYLSYHMFEKGSFCMKDPLKYIDGIKDVLANAENEKVYIKLRGYELTTEEKNNIKSKVEKVFKEDPERKCILFTTNEDLKKMDSIQQNLVILEPNWIYFLEGVIAVLLISLLTWMLSALLYYKLIIYIIFGDKK